MHDSMSVQVLDRGEHLAHDVGGLALGESLRGHDAIEQLTTLAVLHHNMHVAMIDIALIKLDNVWMVYRLQNSELLLQKFDIFGDVFAQD